eukprot:11473060-Ditylum_brightwellii.AAC.1
MECCCICTFNALERVHNLHVCNWDVIAVATAILFHQLAAGQLVAYLRGDTVKGTRTNGQSLTFPRPCIKGC